MRFLKIENAEAVVILSAKEASKIAESENDEYSDYNVDRSELFSYIFAVTSNGGREIEFPRALHHKKLLVELIHLGYELKLEGINLHIRW